VCRLVVGGTTSEFGYSQPQQAPIAVALGVDPGNFKTDDEAFVFLDALSAPAGSNWASLNQYEIAAPHSKTELIGRFLGDIASHELGHLFGNFHTYSPERTDIMDVAGSVVNAAGPDKVFGTDDDVDEHFGVADYFFFSGFSGTQDSLNVISFGLATGKEAAGPATSVPISSTIQSSIQPRLTGIPEDNQTRGSHGASGDGWGVVVAALVETTVNVIGSTMADDAAIGGALAGADRGNGYVDVAHNDNSPSLTLRASTIARSHVNGSDHGIGGGVYNLGNFDFDALTLIVANHASTSDDDVFDPFA